LKGHFENYHAEVDRLHQPLLIIESSGINQALNQLLAPYSPFIAVQSLKYLFEKKGKFHPKLPSALYLQTY
jgi:hypothetical protein